MQNQQSSSRKARTKQLIQVGDLLQKAGLLEAFHIEPGDDLQSYKARPKATKLLGFLIVCFEEKTFNEETLEKWQALGERYLL